MKTAITVNDLISRSALLENVKGAFNRHYEKSYYQCIHDFFNAAIKRMNNAPAVDAVEVVPCKDCKWLYDGMDMYCCTKHTGLALIKPDGSGFCSYGERRDNNVR